MSPFKRLMIIFGLFALTGCQTITPYSLHPQPTLLFGLNKEGRRIYVLNNSFPYCDKLTGQVFVVQKGFVTDFTSVPWFGRSLIDPEGPTARAALIHDWLYAIGEKNKRKEADDIFYRAMIKYGVDDTKARIAYNAVRLGGENGYGLKTDWWFIDPKLPTQQIPIPPSSHIAKPKTATVAILKNCENFDENILSGWHPDKPRSRNVAF